MNGPNNESAINVVSGLLNTFVMLLSLGRRTSNSVFVEAYMLVALIGRRGRGGGKMKPMCLVHMLAPLDLSYLINQIFCEWSNQLIGNHCGIWVIKHIRNGVGAWETQSDQCFHQGPYVSAVDWAQGRGGIQTDVFSQHVGTIRQQLFN